MKKLTLSMCLIIATAAALPSLAMAKPVITHPTGTVLATGTKITGTNVGNVVFTTPIGNITCTTATLTGELNTNSTANGSAVTIISAVFGGTGATIPGDTEPECTGSGFVGNTGITAVPPYCLEMKESNDKVTGTGGSCTEAAKVTTFRMTITGFGGTAKCGYSKAFMSGTTRTDSVFNEDVTAAFSEEEFIKFEGGGECPASFKLDMTITMETDTVAATPIYLSS